MLCGMHFLVARAKCTVIIRLWNFLAILMSKHAKDLFKVSPSLRSLVLCIDIITFLPYSYN